MPSSAPRLTGIALACLFAVSLAHAEGDPENTAAVAPKTRPLPPYSHPYKDGLYSTIVSVISYGAPEIKNEKEYKLKIKSFKDDAEVHGIVQDGPAPLVVVLVGVDGKSSSPMGRLFPWWLNDAGFHVLYFDSTFRPTFMKRCRQGVTGNLEKEADQIVEIIQAFTEQTEIKGKVTRIGVAGYSLGGTQALILGKRAAEDKLPFKLEGCVAFSPLVRIKSTAAILDDYYARDRWKYTMVDMAKTFLTHEPVKPGEKVPFEPDFMRAGIGYIIRDEFTYIVDRNDTLFRLKAIPALEELKPGQNRKSICEVEWGFQRFMEKMSFPYWQKEGAFKDVEELWRSGDLTEIMKKQPGFVRALTCENDPFNKPEDLEELKKVAEERNLKVVPLGGHLGFIGSYWCHEHLLRMFEFK